MHMRLSSSRRRGLVHVSVVSIHNIMSNCGEVQNFRPCTSLLSGQIVIDVRRAYSIRRLVNWENVRMSELPENNNADKPFGSFIITNGNDCL